MHHCDRSSSLATSIRRALGIATLTLAAFAAHAQSPLEAIHRFEIPAQNTSDALNEFSKQSGLRLLFSYEALEGRAAPQVNGDYTVEQVLDRLLSGTDLKYEIADGVVVVREPNRSQKTSHTIEGSVGSTLRVAQVEGETSATNETYAAKGTTEEGHAERRTVEEVVVTGTHIRGSEQLAAPSVSISRDDIEKSGYTKIEDVFRSLPQAFAGLTQESPYGTGGSAASLDNLRERVAAVDLRGLGAQSTLTLVNGTRRAPSANGRVVDISSIPVGMIERVDIVTGGRSAVLGADAVAGVANVITRRDFNGAETQVSVGWPTEYGGGNRFQVNQIFGRDREKAGFVVAYDYARDELLDLMDTGVLAKDAVSGGLTRWLSMAYQPEMTRHSAMLSGRYALSDRVGLVADGHYMKRDSVFPMARRYVGASEDSLTKDFASSEQFGGSLGATIDLEGDWKLAVKGVHSVADNPNQSDESVSYPGSAVSTSWTEVDFRADLTSVTAVADGPLPSVGVLRPRAAFGVERREERYDWQLDFYSGTASVSRGSSHDRSIWSAFGELLVPVVGEASSSEQTKLQLSLAARYDDYSDAGHTFNPQAGIVWNHTDSLAFRGAISSAFRAPALMERNGSAAAVVLMVADPSQPSGTSPLLWLQGNDSNVGPEEAETLTLGLDYDLPFAPTARLSLSYFSVNYDKRIDQPVPASNINLALVRESDYSTVITRNPTVAQLAQFLAPNTTGVIYNQSGMQWDPSTQSLLEAFPGIALLDNRVTNIAIEKVRGIDFGLNGVSAFVGGRLAYGLNAAYTLEQNRKMTPTSAAVSMLNDVGKPVDLRIRATLGWERGAFGTQLTINHVDDYESSYSTPLSRMPSWTTADVTVSLDGAAQARYPTLRSIRASLSVTNLTGREPPRFVGSANGIMYDSFNANPLGRYISLRMTHVW